MRANSKVKAVLWGTLLWVSGGMASPIETGDDAKPAPPLAQSPEAPALPQPPISATASKASAYGSDQQLVYKEVDGRSLQLFIYKPKGWAASDKRPVVVYFHGGGWIGGNPGAVKLHLESWRAKGMVVISVQYRLVTKGKLDPACCIEDAKSAMRYIRGQAAELGIDPKRITACGNSAGGHLAAACALLATFDCPSDDLTISCRPDAMMLLVPVLDNGPEKGYEGRNTFIQANVKAYSPAHNVAPDAPPTIIFGGAKDLFADLSRLRKFTENMKAAGNDCELYAYEGAHGFVYHSPDKEDIEEKMSAFLDRLASRVRLPGEPRRVGSNPQQTNNNKVLAALNVAPVWSTHNTGTPVLLTGGEYQYVLYYDKDRRVAIAQRKLASDTWSYYTFPEVLGWAHGAHCNLSMAVDKQGCIHASAYNRSFSKTHAGPIYYRSENPHDIARWTTLPITTVPVPCYPTFIQSADNRLIYMFREGSAVKGDNLWCLYDEEKQQWEARGVLFAGAAQNRYTYNTLMGGGARSGLGPDGYVHCAYVWADATTPDNLNTVSYIRSKDMVSWETAAGEKLSLPITYDTRGTVAHPVPHNKGNTGMVLGFDGKKRPVVSNSNFDNNGNNQIYNSRFENGAWINVQATDWDYRNRFAFNDVSVYLISFGSVQPLCEGTLLQSFKHVKFGEGFIVLDEKTLKPLGKTHEYTLVPGSALKLTRTVTASSELAGFEAAKAVDGDPKSRWQPKPDDKEPWLELDFGHEITFEHFSLLQLRLNITAFDLRYWDGTQWQQAYHSTKLQTTYHNVDWMYPIRPVTTSKVRLAVTSFLQKPTPHERKGELPVPSVCRFEVYTKDVNPGYPKHLKTQMCPWPVELEKQESTFTLRPMTVDWVEDSGGTAEAGAKYYLRWERGPSNRDSEVPQPWPDPTLLRVYKLKTVKPEAYAAELLKAVK